MAPPYRSIGSCSSGSTPRSESRRSSSSPSRGSGDSLFRSIFLSRISLVSTPVTTMASSSVSMRTTTHASVLLRRLPSHRIPHRCLKWSPQIRFTPWLHMLGTFLKHCAGTMIQRTLIVPGLSSLDSTLPKPRPADRKCTQNTLGTFLAHCTGTMFHCARIVPKLSPMDSACAKTLKNRKFGQIHLEHFWHT